jgi:hypothetical protein
MTLPLPLPLQGTETSVRRRFLAALSQATTIAGVSGAKAQEQIKKLGTDLLTRRLGAFPW